MLPKEMIKEFIGKVCYVSVFDEGTVICRVLETEDNWIKIKDESGVSMVNGDMVRKIRIAPEKHQNKFQ